MNNKSFLLSNFSKRFLIRPHWGQTPMWSEAAKAEHPERWNGRATRDWSLPDTVYLNPEKVHEQSEKADGQMAVS